VPYANPELMKAVADAAHGRSVDLDGLAGLLAEDSARSPSVRLESSVSKELWNSPVGAGALLALPGRRVVHASLEGILLGRANGGSRSDRQSTDRHETAADQPDEDRPAGS
jgi:hypothetical protein